MKQKALIHVPASGCSCGWRKQASGAYFSILLSLSTLACVENSPFRNLRGEGGLLSGRGGSYSALVGSANLCMYWPTPVYGKAGRLFGFVLTGSSGGLGAKSLNSLSGKPVGWPVFTLSFRIFVTCCLEGRLQAAPGPSMVAACAYHQVVYALCKLDKRSAQDLSGRVMASIRCC